MHDVLRKAIFYPTKSFQITGYLLIVGLGILATSLALNQYPDFQFQIVQDGILFSLALCLQFFFLVQLLKKNFFKTLKGLEQALIRGELEGQIKIGESPDLYFIPNPIKSPLNFFAPQYIVISKSEWDRLIVQPKKVA